MWHKHINLKDARALSIEFCNDFNLMYCQIFMVDILENQGYGQYCYLNPPHILLLDTRRNKNKLGVLMHEMTHHLECHGYTESNCGFPVHGYYFQLAKLKVIKWCEKNISNRPDWKKPLRAFQKYEDMISFKL